LAGDRFDHRVNGVFFAAFFSNGLMPTSVSVIGDQPSSPTQSTIQARTTVQRTVPRPVVRAELRPHPGPLTGAVALHRMPAAENL